MNKVFRYGFYSLLAALALNMASCTSEYSYDAAEPVKANQQASIVADETELNYEYSDETQTFTFDVIRPDDSQAASISLECDNSAVKIPETVEFAQGQNTATVTATANLQMGQTESCTIKVADKDANPYSEENGYYMQKFTLFRDYKWTKVGSCTFYDATFTRETVDGVEIQQYDHDNTIYRLVSPFYALGIAGNKSASIQFKLNADGSANAGVAGTYALNLQGQLSPYGMAYYTSGSYAGYCSFSNKDNVYTCNYIYTYNGEPWNVGRFMFEWTEGCPLQQ